jgi:hypothetical protein
MPCPYNAIDYRMIYYYLLITLNNDYRELSAVFRLSYF